jgi:hypothetical protein
LNRSYLSDKTYKTIGLYWLDSSPMHKPCNLSLKQASTFLVRTSPSPEKVLKLRNSTHLYKLCWKSYPTSDKMIRRDSSHRLLVRCSLEVFPMDKTCKLSLRQVSIYLHCTPYR